MNKMLSIPDYKLKCVDTIFVQNSMEIFSSIINLLTFLKFSSEVLSPRGNIIIKNYDIEDINMMRDKLLRDNKCDSNDDSNDGSHDGSTINRSINDKSIDGSIINKSSSNKSIIKHKHSRVSFNRSINKNTHKYS